MSGPTLTRTVVVSAASRHGGTCEIADRLAETLSRALPDDWYVVRGDLRDLRVLDGADAVVLGSATYYGHWMHSAARALEYLRESLPTDLWLFSTGAISAVESENAQVISADAMAESGEAGEHVVFGGKLDSTHLGFLERVVVKALHAIPGEHRDWVVVDEWARHIASDLSAKPTRGGHGSTSSPQQRTKPAH